MIWWTLAVVAWWIIGYQGFVYWWTHEHAFTTEDRVVALFVGLVLGPLSWLAGKAIHGPANSRPPRIIKGQRR